MSSCFSDSDNTVNLTLDGVGQKTGGFDKLSSIESTAEAVMIILGIKRGMHYSGMMETTACSAVIKMTCSVVVMVVHSGRKIGLITFRW